MKHHATYERFGGDGNLVRAYEHWSVLIRPKQATLGACVIVAHSDAQAMGDLPDAAFAEFGRVVRDLEAAWATAFAPDKRNYLCLMMVDKEVHYHALPRFEAPVMFEGSERLDAGWPGPPDLSASVGDVADAARTALVSAWPAAGDGSPSQD